MFEAYLNNPNVKAFLDVLAYCEGANYNTVYGGGTFNGNQHPFRTVSAGRYTSDAAGRYQFLGSTWRGLQGQYGFSDFSPYNQDLGAIALIAQHGGLNAIANGDLETGVNAVKGVWPSLPGGSQQTRNWSQVSNYFQNDLLAQGASLSDDNAIFADNTGGGGWANFNPGFPTGDLPTDLPVDTIPQEQSMFGGTFGIITMGFVALLLISRLLGR